MESVGRCREGGRVFGGVRRMGVSIFVRSQWLSQGKQLSAKPSSEGIVWARLLCG